MCDLIEKLSNLRSQYNCFDENEHETYHTLSEAIKVLSEQPEPCEDTVSRADVETEIANLLKGVFVEYEDIAKKATAKLPSVTPKAEPQWIPVTERLPEEYGNYLISIHGEDEPDIGTINPKNKRGWSLCDASGFYWASDKSLIVTAWMPFPEPYKPKEKNDACD